MLVPAHAPCVPYLRPHPYPSYARARPTRPLTKSLLTYPLAQVLKSREAAEQLHCVGATLPCNSTRAAAVRGGPNGYPAAVAE